VAETVQLNVRFPTLDAATDSISGLGSHLKFTIH